MQSEDQKKRPGTGGRTLPVQLWLDREQNSAIAGVFNRKRERFEASGGVRLAQLRLAKYAHSDRFPGAAELHHPFRIEGANGCAIYALS